MAICQDRPMQTRAIALAVDLGGTKVEAALVDADGAVVSGSSHRSPTGRDATSEHIADAVCRVAEAALAGIGGGDRLIGIGIGSAGPVDLA
jgi:glucokinase